MALSNHTEISSTIGKWLNREGFTEITDEIDDFILLAHKRVVREVRAPFMEKDQALSVSDTTGEAALPADYLDVKSLIATDTSASKTFALVRAPRYVVESMQSQAGAPRFYEATGSAIHVGPNPAAGDTFLLEYYADPGPITAAQLTNSISDAAPELYLYGALQAAAIFMKDGDVAGVYDAEFVAAKSRVEAFAAQYDSSGDPLTGRAERPYREANATDARAVEIVRQALQSQGQR